MSRLDLDLDVEDSTAFDAGVAANIGKASATLTALKLVAEQKVRAVNTVAASSTAQTIPDVTVATVSDITLTGNCTFTFPSSPAGKRLVIRLTQDGTGSRLATWPAAVKWAGATAPTLSTAAGKIDVFEFTGVGTTWVGHTVGLDVR